MFSGDRPNMDCGCLSSNFRIKGNCGYYHTPVGIIKMSTTSPDISRGKCKPVYHNKESHGLSRQLPQSIPQTKRFVSYV